MSGRNPGKGGRGLKRRAQEEGAGGRIGRRGEKILTDKGNGSWKQKGEEERTERKDSNSQFMVKISRSLLHAFLDESKKVRTCIRMDVYIL